jgi:gliding motility-associated-like protein
MLYSVTSGPNTRAPQFGDQFGSLPAGIYTLMVTDLNNDTTKINDTISGHYASPNFSPTYTDPPCPGSNTGVIIGNPLINTGTQPFTWVLTNLTTHVATTQSSDTFSNLPPASYTLREYDSCGNFSTYSVTLLAPIDSFAIVQLINEIIPCDSVRLKVTLFILNGQYAAPYTIKVQTHNGTYQHTITNMIYEGTAAQFLEDVGGVSYGDYINITVTDACGRSEYLANTVADYHLQIYFTGQPGSCAIKYIASFTLEGDSTQSNVNTTFFPDPVTIIVRNASTGAFIDSTVTNDTSNHFSEYAYSAALTGNQNYSIEVKDGCGHTNTQIYAWPITPPPVHTGSLVVSSCMDSTACYQFQWTYTFFTDPTFELLSGPGYISSTKPHYVYNDTIIYPQTFLATGGSNGYFLQLTNLAAGTYHYRVFDSCGNSITDSFTIRKQDLNSDKFTTNYIKGCPGQNVISTKNDIFSYAFLSGPGISTISLTSPTDTIINLNYGTYIPYFYYVQPTYAQPINQNATCQIIRDTINIPAYIPPQISYADQIACHGTMYLAFQPDSATGVAPYRYEILSGPVTTGVQASNLFTLSLPGSYLARVSDSCGYASTFSFTVDTASFADVVKAGSSCVGYSATLSAQYSPYATYVWQLPSGTTYIGDSLVLSPIAVSDFGLYNLKKIVSINGCKDTFYTTYTFAGNPITQTYASVCPGQSISFGGLSHSLAGTYLDTIHTSSCDSIVALNLTIRGPVYDSVAQIICPGQSVIVGLHTYTATGIYRDTFVTAGCDSIHILNLHLNGYSYDSISTMVCPGQSFLFGGIARSAAGLYYDTIPTAECDSIVTLNLTIRGPLYDSVSQTICEGMSASAGVHTYTTTGIYRDTLATGGCDSVHVLNLHVTPYGTSTISQIICPGQSYLFGGTSLTLAGVYHDTIPTAGCDSIVTLNLTIRGPLYDSVSQTICEGTSASAGTHTYTTTGIYRDTIPTAGCDSIHVLNLHVTPYGQSSVSQVICPGQSYLFGGTSLTLAGVYHDTIPTTGCDSIVTLALSIRGPLYDSVSQTICEGQSLSVGIHNYTSAGLYYDTLVTGACDSIHVLNLQVTPYLIGSVSTSICPGQALTFGNATLTLAGVYYDTIPTTGCDSIVTLTLSIRGPVYDSVAQSICPGQSVTVGTNTYTSTGIYRDTFATAGCDSIHILNLQVGVNGTSGISQIICPGQTLVFGSAILTQAGVYYDTIPTTACDSIVTLTLNIHGPLYDSVSQTICQGSSISAGTHTYTTTGIYYDTIPTAGCDSIHVLNLQVTPYGTSSESQVLCPGQNFLFAGNTLTQGGVYYDTIPTTGCDSIVTLTLSIRGPLYDSVSQTICTGQSVSVGIHNYTSAGLYYDTLVTGACDSIHVLNLQVSPYLTGSVSAVICPGQTLVFGGNTLSQAGVYYDTISTTGCDSIVTLTLSIRGPLYDSVSQTICAGQSVSVGIHNYTSTGLYYDTIATAGCDSIHVLNLAVSPYGTGTVSTMICPGQTLLFGSAVLSRAGVYYDTIPTIGCDSIVTLALSIRGPLYDSVTQTICAGQSVAVGFNTYTTSGLYRDTIPTAGCDSIYVLDLKVSPYITSSFSANICPGQSVSVGSNIYSTSGTYMDTVSASLGCDTVITTHLIVISPVPQTQDTNGICALIYQSQLYTSDATVIDTFSSILGCDSIYLSVNIHITPPGDTVISTAACIYSGQSYTVGGQTHSAPGTYSDTVRTALGGCDSVITNTNLRVITPQYTSQHIDSCFTATVGGITYTSDTLLRDTIQSSCGLDSIVAVDSIHLYEPSVIVISSSQLPIIAGESTQLTITPSGDYLNIIWSPNYDISSITSPNPTVSPRQDTIYYVTAEDQYHCIVSAQIQVTVVGNDEPDFLMPTAFSPNGDGNNDIYRPVIKNGPLDVLSFQIYDRWGQKVYDNEITGIVGWDGTYKNVKQPIGVYIYYIQVRLSSGNVVKQSGNLTLIR